MIEILRPIALGIRDAEQIANEIVITNKAQADSAAAQREAMLTASATAEKSIREFDNNLTERLFKTHRRWTGLIAMFTVPLEEPAKIIKQKIIAYQEAEAEEAAKETLRLQAAADEAARKERERLEKLAASRKTPELQEAYREQAEAVVAPVIYVEPPKSSVRSQKRWKVKSFDLTQMGIPAEVQGFVEVNITNLERSKAYNNMLTVKGVEFHQVTI